MKYVFIVHADRAGAYELLFDFKLEPQRVRFGASAHHAVTMQPYVYAFDSLSEPERATIYASILEQLGEGFFVESQGAEYVKIYSQITLPDGVLNVLAGAIIQTEDVHAALESLGLIEEEDLP